MAHGLIWQMAHQISPWIHCLKCARMRLYNSIETDTPQKHPLNNLALHKDEDWKVEGRRRQGLVLSPFRQILPPSVLPGDPSHPAVVHHLFCLLETLFCLAYR